MAASVTLRVVKSIKMGLLVGRGPTGFVPLRNAAQRAFFVATCNIPAGTEVTVPLGDSVDVYDQAGLLVGKRQAALTIEERNTLMRDTLDAAGENEVVGE